MPMILIVMDWFMPGNGGGWRRFLLLSAKNT